MSLDQLSLLLGLFKGKPIAIVSVSHGLSGGLHPQYELRKILIYERSHVMGLPEVAIA